MKKRFDYALDPLLRKRELDAGAAQLEEARTARIVQALESEAYMLERAIVQAQESLRKIYAEGTPVDPEEHRRISAYLEETRDQLQAKQEEISAAKKEHQEATRRLYSIRQGVKALERHKDGKRREHVVEWDRVEQKEVDDLWLMREGHRKQHQ